MRTEPKLDATILSARFADYEEFAEGTRGWSFDFRQLDRGQSPSRLVQVATPDVNVMHVGLSRHYTQAGASPPGFVTIGLVEESVGGAMVCGQGVTTDTLQIVAPDKEFDGLSRPGFDAYIFTIREELLADAATRAGVSASEELLGLCAVQRAHPESVHALRLFLRRLANAADSGAAASAVSISEALSELPERVILAMAASRPLPSPGPLSFRARVRRSAVDWIDENLDVGPRVADACSAVGASRRTLEYAFREHFGLSPKAYITARRLVAARKALRDAQAGERVIDVANRLGFWHMGEFAAAYRRHFGERPSSTLGRRG